MQLIQLSHLLFLEVLDLLLSLGEFLVDGALLTLHTLLLVLEVTDVELDAILGIVEHETVVTKALDFVDLGVLAELWIEVVIVIVVVVLFWFFFLGVFTVFVTFTIVLLGLFRATALLSDLLVKGENLIVVLVIRIDQLVELIEELSLFLLDLLDVLSLSNQLARDILNFANDESLGLSALLELIAESEVLRLHRLEQDQLFKQEQKLQFSALKVPLEPVLLLLHLFDLLVEIVDVAVDIIV